MFFAQLNHKQPNSDVTGGYLRLTPERLREPAQQVEDRLLKLARAKRGQNQAMPELGAAELLKGAPVVRWAARN